MKYENTEQIFIEFLKIASAIYESQYDKNDLTGEATLTAKTYNNRKIKVVITMSEIDEDETDEDETEDF